MTPPTTWRGVVVAEGLRDPTIINSLRVVRAHITDDDLFVDDYGNQGRWHLYWVEVTAEEISRIQAQTLPVWYAHFWAGNRLVVVYHDARFDLVRDDRSTWQPAIDHGLSQGLPPEWLDFPVE